MINKEEMLNDLREIRELAVAVVNKNNAFMEKWKDQRAEAAELYKNDAGLRAAVEATQNALEQLS